MWGVDYAVADSETALAMLALPVSDVRAALDRDWARWTNAANLDSGARLRTRYQQRPRHPGRTGGLPVKRPHAGRVGDGTVGGIAGAASAAGFLP